MSTSANPIATAPAIEPCWYIHQQGSTYGPFSSERLKELADNFRLSREARVRGANGGVWISEWVAADGIEGLFPAANALVPASAPEIQPVGIPHATTQTPVVRPSMGATSTSRSDAGFNVSACKAPVVTNTVNTTVVIAQSGERKSVGVAILLTMFFGPFGMFYSTPLGGAIMLGVAVVIWFLCFFLIGFLLIPFAWVAQIVWAAAACRGNPETIVSRNASQVSRA